MRAANVFFNFVSIVFLLLTLGVVVYAIAIASESADPPFLAPPTDVPTPTLINDFGTEELPTPFLPTFTPSHTPTTTDTPEPTATPPPETPTPSAAATATPAGGDSQTGEDTEGNEVGSAALAALPTLTPAPPTRAPSATPTASLTVTLTPGPRPTDTVTPTPQGSPPPTFSPYPFVVQQGTPLLRESFAEGTTGCAWQGIAGTVVNQRGEAVVGVEVHVRSASEEQIALAGTDTDYGPSGWEVRIGGEISAARVSVDLWSSGEQLSPTVEMQFPNTCQQNLALVNFVQTRPF